jgi:hypothetical protein
MAASLSLKKATTAEQATEEVFITVLFIGYYHFIGPLAVDQGGRLYERASFALVS